MILTKNIITTLLAVILTSSCTNKQIDTSVYLDPSRPIEERVEALLSQMTLEEKSGKWTW